MRTETAVSVDGHECMAELALTQPVLRTGPSDNVIKRRTMTMSFFEMFDQDWLSTIRAGAAASEHARKLRFRRTSFIRALDHDPTNTSQQMCVFPF